MERICYLWRNRIKGVEYIIFNLKWMLIPALLYLGWCLGKLIFEYIFFHKEEENIMDALQAIDVTMIATLIVMIITGSYHSFVSKKHTHDIDKISSGFLKVKLSTSIMGVALIYLLKIFLAASDKPDQWVLINKQLVIFGAMMLASITLSITNYLHHKSESH